MSADPKGTLLAARPAQEIGADFGEKAEMIEQVFALVYMSIQAGGKGIAIGRNIWEHGKTKAVVEAMVGIGHDGWTVKQALAYGG